MNKKIHQWIVILQLYRLGFKSGQFLRLFVLLIAIDVLYGDLEVIERVHLGNFHVLARTRDEFLQLYSASVLGDLFPVGCQCLSVVEVQGE